MGTLPFSEGFLCIVHIHLRYAQGVFRSDWPPLRLPCHVDGGSPSRLAPWLS